MLVKLPYNYMSTSKGSEHRAHLANKGHSEQGTLTQCRSSVIDAGKNDNQGLHVRRDPLTHRVDDIQHVYSSILNTLTD